MSNWKKQDEDEKQIETYVATYIVSVFLGYEVMRSYVFKDIY